MAKHYIARPVTENPGYMQAQIKVPAATTLYAGEVVVAENLDNTIAKNYQVYVPTQVTDIGKENIALILNGSFETLEDGRRPAGNPDYTQYIFQPGDVVTAHRLLPETRFELSIDSCDDTVISGTVKPGDNLVPKTGQYTLTYSAASETVTAKNYLTVEALKYMRIGGQSGIEYAPTMVVRAKVLDATA